MKSIVPQASGKVRFSTVEFILKPFGEVEREILLNPSVYFSTFFFFQKKRVNIKAHLSVNFMEILHKFRNSKCYFE